MGALLQFPWPKRKSKYSLALRCSDCGYRMVVEPAEVFQREDADGRAVVGEFNVVYGSDADTCGKCGGDKVQTCNPPEWREA